ncbi:DUF3053 domain-containing protein [bacterium]|nr:DUF3053 domain-containing protein [bacterium]
MKTVRFLALITLFSSVAFAGASNGVSDGVLARDPSGGRHPSFGHHRLNADQRKAFEACLQTKGIAVPERPAFTDAQKKAFETCRGQGEGREDFKACMSEQGVALPKRPDMSAEQRVAIHECRAQARQTN